jgi:hypothetical protein
MKKATRTYGIITVLIVAFTIAFAPATMANEGDKPKSPELKMIGKVQNQPVFQLNFNNTQEDEYSVVFRDDFGNVIYAHTFKGTNISKKFMLKPEENTDSGKLNVVVKSKNKNQADTYIINRNIMYVEETVVSKIR